VFGVCVSWWWRKRIELLLFNVRLRVGTRMVIFFRTTTRNRKERIFSTFNASLDLCAIVWNLQTTTKKLQEFFFSSFSSRRFQKTTVSSFLSIQTREKSVLERDVKCGGISKTLFGSFVCVCFIAVDSFYFSLTSFGRRKKEEDSIHWNPRLEISLFQSKGSFSFFFPSSSSSSIFIAISNNNTRKKGKEF